MENNGSKYIDVQGNEKSMIIDKRMKMFHDTEDQKFTGLWTYDTEHPLVYKLSLPKILKESRELTVFWGIGRSLVRSALDDHKLGGVNDILIMPSLGGVTLIYLSNGVDAAIIGMETSELVEFHRRAHKLISEDEEMNLTMDKLMSEVQK